MESWENQWQKLEESENKPDKIEYAVNREHAFAVLDEIMDTFYKRVPPFDRMELPTDEKNMPELLRASNTNNIRGGKEHAMFLFTGCYFMRGGVQSDMAFRTLAKIFSDQPELFDCEYIADEKNEVSADKIVEVMQEFNLGNHKMGRGAWVENAHRLLERFGGDPRRIFDGVTSYDEAVAVIANGKESGGFWGFQEKMASMYIYYLDKENIYHPDYPYPAPSDFHVARITAATEMITGNVPLLDIARYGNGVGQESKIALKESDIISEEFLELTRKLHLDYIDARGASPMDMTDAIWSFSRSMCSRAPGNMTRVIGETKGRNTVVELVPINPDSRVQQRKQQRSCGACLLDACCKLHIPNGIYYKSGRFVATASRSTVVEKFDSAQLFNAAELPTGTLPMKIEPLPKLPEWRPEEHMDSLF